MDLLDFSEEEIQQQLALLGYKNIPKHRLLEFKRDLDELIQRGEWRTLVSSPPTPPQSQPNPPPYIKEKVGSTRGFFLHEEADGDRRTLITHLPRGDQGQRRPAAGSDSYAHHSVAPKLWQAAEAPCRLQVESDSDLTLTSTPDSHTSSLDPRKRCFIKRKVLRKHQGEQHICDESVYSEDSDAASCLQERLAELHLSPSARPNMDDDEEEGDNSSDSEAGSLSALESYIRGLTQTCSDGALRPKPKSFIRPALNQNTIKKSDPVARHFQYKQIWDLFKCPGETDHRALRWEIRERLAFQPPPPRPRRVLVPNTYVVPTEKKRSALRWEVRAQLANGLQPYKSNCRF